MKTISLMLISAIIQVQIAFAQVNWRHYSQTFSTGALDDRSTVGLMTLIKEDNNYFWNQYGINNLEEELRAKPSFKSTHAANFTVVTAFDDENAFFILHGVGKSNKEQFQYRVSNFEGPMNTRWNNITGADDTSLHILPGWPLLTSIGGYKAPLGKGIIVDVRNRSSQKMVSTAVVIWKKIQPELADIFTSSELKAFLNQLAHPDDYKIFKDRIKKWHGRYPDNLLEPSTNLPKKLVLRADQNNLIFYIKANITGFNQLEYQLIKDGKIDKLWQGNDFSNSIIWLKDLEPGNYTLKFRFAIQRQSTAEYSFNIGSKWYQKDWFYIGLISFVTGLVILIIWILKLVRQQILLRKERGERRKAESDIQIVRAQLNPHFIFNSMTSIQNLIVSGKNQFAIDYLSNFAQLLRSTLLFSKREFIPLFEELKIVEVYLKLEQLRFEFSYKIDIQDNINQYETDAPTLLIQPLLENSVKHGIGNLGSNGNVHIKIVKAGKQMIIFIKDNGSGFKPNDQEGYGLSLTRERINLLNKILDGRYILLDIQSKIGFGTEVRLTFNNWFNEN